jgi:PhnB protein
VKAVVTYLNFDGNTRDAMKFYARCLGGELSMMPFSEAPGDFPKEAKDRLMHSRITKGGSVLLMASDTMPGYGDAFKQGTNFSISLDCESQEEVDRLFAAFSENAKKIDMPLQDAFWGARFGMLTDQFGIRWMFNFEKQKK